LLQPRAEPGEPKRPPAGAVALLALLQREGRFVDFLMEEIDGYSDNQIGAAVRDIHRGCRRAMAEHLPLAPVLAGSEESPVHVPDGFDASAIRLTGDVPGDPPFRGTLKHHGWRIERSSLPQPPGGTESGIVAPAEVEL
jgi:hypothetical protein